MYNKILLRMGECVQVNAITHLRDMPIRFGFVNPFRGGLLHTAPFPVA